MLRSLLKKLQEQVSPLFRGMTPALVLASYREYDLASSLRYALRAMSGGDIASAEDLLQEPRVGKQKAAIEG